MAAALPQVPAEAGAMEGVDGNRESRDTELVAVVAVAGTDAGFGAHWRQAGSELSLQRGIPRASSLAAAAAAAAAAVGIAGGQQAELEQLGDTACAGQEQGDRQVNRRQRCSVLGDDRM